MGEILIVTQADINSGTLSSVEYALKMGKKVYTLPHRLNESAGTQELLQNGLIEAIYDIDKFVEDICGIKINSSDDEVLNFCRNNPTYDEAMYKFPNKIFEYELEGKIKIENGRMIVL